MRKLIVLMTVACYILSVHVSKALAEQEKFRRLPVKEYVDKMKAGWVGQMAGVGWGGPTEGDFMNEIMPEDAVPEWKPETVNQFNQDDLYVDMTFMRTLELYGLDVPIRQAGIDFASSGYKLWHANQAGRNNLRSGIAPPDSGHPQFNKHADDIDYQIEADFSGLIAPGMPNLAVELGEKFGRLMNYGDGVYGGQFMGAMYAEAFFEGDMEKLVQAGLAHIPQGSQYHECISDVLKWYRQYPDDWQKTWKLVSEKYHSTEAYGRFRCVQDLSRFNIDAKFNGAWVVVGMLYGRGDPDKTIAISMRCGEDSDCNPSSAAGVLFTTIGFRNLPGKFKSGLDSEGTFSYSPYNFPKLVEVSQRLVRQAVLRAGGRLEKNASGEEVFVIPVQEPRPSRLEQCWEPGPVADSRFTEEERKRIIIPPPEEIKPANISEDIEKFAPGWKVSKCGDDMDPGLHTELEGKKNVLVTHPLDEDTGCVVSKKVKIPDGKTLLRLVVGHHPEGDWELLVKADGKELLKMVVGKETCKDGWMDVDVDLTDYAGKTVELEIVNQANNWAWEAAYWAQIKLESKAAKCPLKFPGSATLTKEALLDKIRGGWVGKAYGVSFGGPTEFRYQGRIIEKQLTLDTEGLEELPGQDDMYVNMALLKAVVDHGLNASASDFAQEFAYGGFLLWHANGQGRQNILAGIPPEKSGHPLYNPHADDIDFQIECDFIGLISPGLPQAAQKICNRAGHLMNYGDGLYGGYFVTAMYAAAFIENDAQHIVKAGLNALPQDSGYAEIIRDVVKWHKQYPNDFKATWHEVEKKYNHDLCPWGVKRKFNIQARLNGSYIAMGLLYGNGDLLKTVEISTRCGQDSDCNPANAGGIIGAMLGFENLPEKIKTAMAPHMNTDFHFTPFSIESASKECARLAMKNVAANAGTISDDSIQIKVQPFRADGPAEVSFPTLEPVDMFPVTDKRITWKGRWKLFPKGDESMRRTSQPDDVMEVKFTGNVIYVQGDLRYDQGILEVLIDGKSMGTRDMYLPKKWKRADQSTAVWLTGLARGEHKLQVRVTGRKNEQSEGIMVSLGKVVTYRGAVAEEK